MTINFPTDVADGYEYTYVDPQGTTTVYIWIDDEGVWYPQTAGKTGPPGPPGPPGTQELIEKVIVRNTKPYLIDIENANVFYYDTAHSGNIQLNFRYTVFLGLNTELFIGETVAITVLVTTNASDYYVTSVQIDEVAQTVKWMGGAPTESEGSGVDAYSFQIIKTAEDTYNVFGSVNNFS